MDKIIVFIIIAIAAVFLFKRFFSPGKNNCGCGCEGCSGSSKPEGCSTEIKDLRKK